MYVEHHQIVTSKDAAVETSAAIIIKSTTETDRVVGGCDPNRTGRNGMDFFSSPFSSCSLFVVSCLSSFGFPSWRKIFFHCLSPLDAYGLLPSAFCQLCGSGNSGNFFLHRCAQVIPLQHQILCSIFSENGSTLGFRDTVRSSR